MLERFVLLKSSIQKALIDLNYPICFNDNDFALMTEIIDVLVPVKLTEAWKHSVAKILICVQLMRL